MKSRPWLIAYEHLGVEEWPYRHQERRTAGWRPGTSHCKLLSTGTGKGTGTGSGTGTGAGGAGGAGVGTNTIRIRYHCPKCHTWNDYHYYHSYL